MITECAWNRPELAESEGGIQEPRCVTSFAGDGADLELVEMKSWWSRETPR